MYLFARDSPDTGSTAAIVRSLSPYSKSSRHRRVVPGSPGCISAAADVPPGRSRPFTSALRADFSCVDPGIERPGHVSIGLGLSRSIRRRISANRARGTPPRPTGTRYSGHGVRSGRRSSRASRAGSSATNARPSSARPTSQEVGEIVGERVRPEAYSVVPEGMTGQPRSAERVLALFDPLLCRFWIWKGIKNNTL